jgi:hypothetical protein
MCGVGDGAGLLMRTCRHMAQVPWWLGSWVESHVLMQASWKMWLQAWSWMMEVRGTLGWDDSGTSAASAEWQMLHSVSVLLVWK